MDHGSSYKQTGLMELVFKLQLIYFCVFFFLDAPPPLLPQSTNAQYVRLHPSMLALLGIRIGQHVIINHKHVFMVWQDSKISHTVVSLPSTLAELVGVKEKSPIVVYGFDAPVLKASHICITGIG